jgi:hypothetical protein
MVKALAILSDQRDNFGPISILFSFDLLINDFPCSFLPPYSYGPLQHR